MWSLPLRRHRKPWIFESGYSLLRTDETPSRRFHSCIAFQLRTGRILALLGLKPKRWFNDPQLTADISKMEGFDTSTGNIARTYRMVDEEKRSAHLGYRRPVEFQAADLDEAAITRLWDDCQPFIIKNAIALMTPEAFLSGVTGEQKCTTSFLDGDAWVDSPSTIQDYFRSWRNGSNAALQVRVSVVHHLMIPETDRECTHQDYPPSGDLSNFHPALFNLFQSSLRAIMPAHLIHTAPLNLASCYPSNSLSPDLGNVNCYCVEGKH